jgi:hypothetical protein
MQTPIEQIRTFYHTFKKKEKYTRLKIIQMLLFDI